MLSRIFFLSVFLSIHICIAQETSTVAIRVDVLGAKLETVRYYHPVDGIYEVEKDRYLNTKKMAALFPNCAFIDPRTHLTEDTVAIQANSLRYYIDPTELVYVNWAMGRDSSNKILLDTFKTSAAEIRKNKYQKLVNDYFRPFYFSKYEVTNREYRAFVYWVMDSLFKETIYTDYSFTDEEVFSLLNASEKSVYYSEEEQQWKTPDLSDREENRKYFSLNHELNVWDEFDADRVIPVLYDFFRQPNERWYKRKEVDVTKLVYRYYTFDATGFTAYSDSIRDTAKKTNIRAHPDKSKFIHLHELAVYPDTNCWVKDSRYAFNDPFSNMYFWHPAYDLYPVVGISWEQARAFCHWKQQQFNTKNPWLEGQFEFDLPTAQEYEWAVCHTHQNYVNTLIQDDQLISDLLLDNSTGEHGQFHELLKQHLIGYTERVDEPFDQANKKESRKTERRIEKKTHSKYISESSSEIAFEALRMRYRQNYLPGRIRFLSNNVSEWMLEDYATHYEKLLSAYINYHCFASLYYCEHQRLIDLEQDTVNHSAGQLIMGANWYDERYEEVLGVNVGGLYSKAFRHADSSFSTVGFRYVVRLQ